MNDHNAVTFPLRPSLINTSEASFNKEMAGNRICSYYAYSEVFFPFR